MHKRIIIVNDLTSRLEITNHLFNKTQTFVYIIVYLWNTATFNTFLDALNSDLLVSLNLLIMKLHLTQINIYAPAQNVLLLI